VERRTISILLNHAESGVTKVYERFAHLPEKHAALEKWAKELERIVGSRGQVVPLRA
jgi:hypothetical protein